jgi:hypothetical protein
VTSSSESAGPGTLLRPGPGGLVTTIGRPGGPAGVDRNASPYPSGRVPDTMTMSCATHLEPRPGEMTGLLYIGQLGWSGAGGKLLGSWGWKAPTTMAGTQRPEDVGLRLDRPSGPSDETTDEPTHRTELLDPEEMGECHIDTRSEADL